MFFMSFWVGWNIPYLRRRLKLNKVLTETQFVAIVLTADFCVVFIILGKIDKLFK
jgi:hypothetical protein